MRSQPNLSLMGLMAEFEHPEDLARGGARRPPAGYRQMDAYTPFPVEGLAEAMGFHRTRCPCWCCSAALLEALGGYLLQYWIAVIDYPLNVGGRPLHSWPAFIPVTFEMTILIAALAAVLGMLPSMVYRCRIIRFSMSDVLSWHAQPLFPMHRGTRPQIRPQRDAAVSGECGGIGGL